MLFRNMTHRRLPNIFRNIRRGMRLRILIKVGVPFHEKAAINQYRHTRFHKKEMPLGPLSNYHLRREAKGAIECKGT
jgi:hypothetical protein